MSTIFKAAWTNCPFDLNCFQKGDICCDSQKSSTPTCMNHLMQINNAATWHQFWCKERVNWNSQSVFACRQYKINHTVSLSWLNINQVYFSSTESPVEIKDFLAVWFKKKKNNWKKKNSCALEMVSFIGTFFKTMIWAWALAIIRYLEDIRYLEGVHFTFGTSIRWMDSKLELQPNLWFRIGP